MGNDANQAFMPSSNDALFAPVDLAGPASSSHQPAAASGHASSSIASPSYGALAHVGSPPNGIMSPQREQVLSASAVPLPPSKTNSAQLTPLLTATDEHTWHGLYNKLQGVVDEERHLWKLERQKLMHEVAALRQELTVARAARVDAPAANGAAESAYFNQNVVAQAQEKLRQFSQVSPHASREPSVAAPRDASCAQHRLPSITEERATREDLSRRVSFAGGAQAPQTAADVEEDPYTPPVTHAMLSPPPENFVRHAGHTPKISRSHRESFVESEAPAPAARPLELPVAPHEPIDDPPLKAPLVLASSPQDNPSMLENLSSRLQEVADHPHEHVPEALQGRDSMESDFARPEPVADTQAVVEGGIRLKASRSMNFGRPLGE